MTKDDVIRIAREADLWMTSDERVAAVERFAALVGAAERNRALGIAKGMQEELQAKFEQTYMEGVIAGAAAEREACAKACEELAAERPTTGAGRLIAQECAAAIRARSNP